MTSGQIQDAIKQEDQEGQPTTAAFRIRPMVPQDCTAIREVKQHFVDHSIRSLYRVDGSGKKKEITTRSQVAILVAESNMRRCEETSRAIGVCPSGHAILGVAVCGSWMPCEEGVNPLFPAGYLQICSPGPIREAGDELVDGALLDMALSKYYNMRPYIQSVVATTLFRPDIAELQRFVHTFELRGFKRVGCLEGVRIMDNGVPMDFLSLQLMRRNQILGG